MEHQSFVVCIENADGTKTFEFYESAYYANEHFKALCEKGGGAFLCKTIAKKERGSAWATRSGT